MTVWFTSDLHFGHKNIIKYENRPFDSVDEMNEAIIYLWNDCIHEDDTVWILGDVAMGKITDSLPLVERLNGIKRLVPGNHDRCWSGHFERGQGDKWYEWKKRYEAVGLSVQQSVEYIVGMRSDPDRGPVMMSHFPYSGESGGKPFDRYPGTPDKGDWLLHGHVHGAWRQNGKQINVGIDAWGGQPVSQTVIEYMMRNDKAVQQAMPPTDEWFWKRHPDGPNHRVMTIPS
jgi:calcineurin-like phosphoesterase family protein